MFDRVTNGDVFREIRELKLEYKTAAAKQAAYNFVRRKYEKAGVPELGEKEDTIRTITNRFCYNLNDLWIKSSHCLRSFTKKNEKCLTNEINLPKSELFENYMNVKL